MAGLPNFFKLILALRNDLQTLQIPGEFMNKYGERISERIMLKVPTGKEWEVKIVRENGKTWLQNGWPEFVEFYSISNAYLLMFKCKTSSCFEVLIMDTTASEIEYPVPHTKTSNKRKRDINNSTTPCSSNKGLGAPKKIYGNQCNLSGDEKKRVEEYHCDGPAFVVRMQPSHVDLKFKMNVPREFTRKHLTSKIGIFIKIVSETSNGKKTWKVNCDNNGHTQVSFTKGWKDLAMDNKLKVGDICVFELVNPTKSALTLRFINLIPAATHKPTLTNAHPQVKVEVVD